MKFISVLVALVIAQLQFSGLATAAPAAAYKPEISSTIHDKLSNTIVYFDDSPVILNLNQKALFRSEDDGKTWAKLDSFEHPITNLYIDPIKKERAFVFTSGKTHYVSNDKGKTWSSYDIDVGTSLGYEVNINRVNPDYIIIGFFDCDENESCHNEIYVSKDGLRTNPRILTDNVSYCVFAKSNDVFDQGHDNAILCLKIEKDFEGVLKTGSVIRSTDFFETSSTIDDTSGWLSKSYIIDLKVVQSYVVVIAQADRYDPVGKALVFTSKDAYNFQKAKFDADLSVDFFEVLPSTKHSLYLSISGIKDGKMISDILSSDSDGIHFKNILDNLAGNFLGFENLEKVETIEGVWIANIANGYDEDTYWPLSKSKITFDDGRTWQYLKTEDCEGNEECSLNLISLDERRGDGQSRTGATPGILVGVGSTGKSLERDVYKLKTYLSRDGGLTWTEIIDAPSIYNFGDLGNIIVAAPYNKESKKLTKTIKYSLNQGKTFESLDLPTEFFPTLLTTTIDGTTTKFILAGLIPKEGEKETSFSAKEIIYSLDFGKAFSRTCGDSDFEDWYARTTASMEFECIFGHKDLYKRRKQDADCFVNKPFTDLVMDELGCTCSEYDYECNFGFTRNSKNDCVPDNKIISQLCKEATTDEITVNKLRKVPGNLCTKGNVDLLETKINCQEKFNTSSRIEVDEFKFSSQLAKYSFLDNSANDEALIVKTEANEIYISHNAGKTFKKFETHDQIFDYYLNPYFKDDIYLVTTTKKIYISYDRGNSFQTVKAPSNINVFGMPLFTFDKNDRYTFIYYGDEHCSSRFSEKCKSVAFLTRNMGDDFKAIKKGVRACDFVGSKYENPVDPDLIYCQQQVPNGFYELTSSTDDFSTEKKLFDSIIGFATTGHFTVVAAVEGESLKAYVTVDGETFAPASFPKDFDVNKQQAYTILGSDTGAIFLHVTTSDREGSEFGALLKSNSNGTSYVMSGRSVNRNSYGFVDFERIEGLEGIIIINTVKNQEEAKAGSNKKFQSKITFNDGADWDFISPPPSDENGAKYPCIGKPLSECALHLHGYTERKDIRDTFSSGSAVGLLLGVGNVGDSLTSMNEASTFITRDGGSTWKAIKSGVYQWEFGDRGSIVVLVNQESTTNVIYYSLDEGQTWEQYQFTENLVNVKDIVTVPSDTSKRFLLVTKSPLSNGEESKTFTLDFDNLFTRQCVLDLTNPDKDDYEYWTPKHPLLSTKCLFGHEAKYLRKLSDRTDCFIGSAPLDSAFKVEKNCTCTRRDYECDYNYVKSEDGTCKLIEGLQPEDHSQVCKANKNVFEYFEPTGYRKIPLSTCQGGQEFDKWNPVPCPGKEKEFNKEHGGELTPTSLFFVVFIPLFVFVFVTWFVYDRGIRRNGGFARFGEIRLGEDDDLIENNTTDKVVNTIVRGGVTVIAVVIATFKLLRILDNQLINKVKNVFSRGHSRLSTRGAGYTSVHAGDFVDHDEDILNDVLDDGDYEIDDEDYDSNDATNNDSIGDEYTDDRNLEI